MSSRRRTILLLVTLAFLLTVAWLGWNRPRQVDMAEYAPADSLIYLEADDLPEIVDGITSTNTWRDLAPAVGLDANLGKMGWLSELAAWTGVGPSELVIYGRAQAAVCVSGFAAAEEPGATLNIRPKAVLLVETHSGERRARAFVETTVGNFVRRAYGESRMISRDEGDAHFTSWFAPEGNRGIFAAQLGSLVVVGNDESALRSTLAVRQGDHPSLSGIPQLGEMRERVGGDGALAFGYVSPIGTRKILEVVALAYAGQSSADPKMQSALAILLPQLADRFLGSAGWSARPVAGAIEDRYFLSMANGLAQRLQSALTPLPQPAARAPEYLPLSTYQLTNYNYLSPEQAWRGLNTAFSSQLDITLAPLVIRFLDESLQPFGIDSPRDFLKAIGPEVTTARLHPDGESFVLVAPVRDAAAAREQLRQRFGSRLQIVKIGQLEILKAAGDEDLAASLVSGYLIMGTVEDVSRCVEAHAGGMTLSRSEALRQSLQRITGAEPTGVVTLTDESEPISALVQLLARRGGRNARPPSDTNLASVLANVPYSETTTRISGDGVERETRSAFGLFGAIISQLALNGAVEK